MADRVSRTARSSSTTKISPLDEPSLIIFPTPHRGKAEIDHVATRRFLSAPQRRRAPDLPPIWLITERRSRQVQPAQLLVFMAPIPTPGCRHKKNSERPGFLPQRQRENRSQRRLVALRCSCANFSRLSNALARNAALSIGTIRRG